MSHPASKLRIAVVTGSRAEFGLLAPVMRAIRGHPMLELLTVAAGSHYMPPAFTHRDVEAEFVVDASVPMQDADDARTGAGGGNGGRGRAADALSLGRGVCGFAAAFDRLMPAWVVVLGDRIEAFAAASAAAIAGIRVAHIHGGDRAEGIADESMRHAITKLAHLHFTATAESALRVLRMGEPSETIHVVGSPAIDGIGDIAPMSDA
ncbi:MAG: UDP-N-acetylglucosamine 2-epimerase, partial [Pyrinomonadaceae bacterium]|nr:UDP-N-acetylglucosamine 2-epimerase [Phycisphaerales bacterium]